MLSQKDELAFELRVALAERGAEYEQALREQATELSLAAERVDQQLATLRHVQRAEVTLLEVSVV